MIHTPFRFLFKYPCRGREKLFFESFESIHNNVADVNNYHVSLTIDLDDEVLNRPEVIERINGYRNTSIEWGLSESKVHAINRNFPEREYEVVICWSNDMVWTQFGFDDMLRIYINSAFPDMDGLFHIPEVDSMEHLNVLYIATKKYYDRFGYIYHPSYKSLWCDNESLAIAKMLGRHHYCGVPGLYEHRNPAYAKYGIERDAKFNADQDFWAIDEANFNERKLRNFDIHLIENNGAETV
jgi:hypothetical protein